MAEYVISDGLVLLKESPSGDIEAAVTSKDGWTDFSGNGLTMTLETTRNPVPLLTFGKNRLPRQLAGARGGTIRLTFARDDGGTPDPYAFLSGIDKSHGRMAFCINLQKAADGDPEATAANPQEAGSMIITRVNRWGPGDGDSAAVVSVDGTLDKDYNTYP